MKKFHSSGTTNIFGTSTSTSTRMGWLFLVAMALFAFSSSEGAPIFFGVAAAARPVEQQGLSATATTTTTTTTLRRRRRRRAEFQADVDATADAATSHAGRHMEEDATEAPTDGDSDAETDAPTVDPDPWEVGTRVYKDFGDMEDGGWWFGTISSYENDLYTVTYEDESTETYDWDSDEIDTLVENADSYVPYPPGTAVATHGENGDGGDGLTGSIISFENWNYNIAWNDGSTGNFDRIYLVESMVHDAAGDNNEAPADSAAAAAAAATETPTADDPDPDVWEAGTHVYKDFGGDNGLTFGTIASFDESTYTYLVSYQGGSVETFPGDSEELDQLVQNADDYVGYAVGQAVLAEFEDGWYSGTITKFEDWVYYITWEDGDEGKYTSIRDVDAMVSAAENETPAPTEDDTENDGDGDGDGDGDFDEETDAPTEEDGDDNNDGNDMIDEEESGTVQQEETAPTFSGGWSSTASNKQAGDNTDKANSPGVPFGIAAVALLALLSIVAIRRRSTSTQKRRRHAELVAEEFKDHLELPEMD